MSFRCLTASSEEFAAHKQKLEKQITEICEYYSKQQLPDRVNRAQKRLQTLQEQGIGLLHRLIVVSDAYPCS